MSHAELTFVCTLFDGHKNVPEASRGFYTPEWADKLWRGIRRWYSQPFRFVCLTGEPSGVFDEDIEVIDFLDDKHNWLNMMEMYRPDLGTGRRITLGLDTVITGSLDDLAGYAGDFAVDSCPFHPKQWCNGITITNGEYAKVIWAKWRELGHRRMLICGKPSELAWMRVFLDNPERLKDLYPGQVLSYPMHVCNKMKEPGEARIVGFHGRSKPFNCTTDWVTSEWI